MTQTIFCPGTTLQVSFCNVTFTTSGTSLKHALLQNSFGVSPQVVQDDIFPEGVSAMSLAEEAGTLLLAIGSGTLLLLNEHGEQLVRTRGFENVTELAWSATGNFGVAAMEGGQLVCFDHKLKTRWDVRFTGEIVGLDIAPYGSHVAVSTEGAQVHIVSIDKKQLTQFETLRPLESLQFLWERPALIGAAEFGHLCCHSLDGKEEWNERIMNNVGNMVVSGDGRRILLSAFNHGVQVLNGKGNQLGSFMVDGIPDRVEVSKSRRKLAVNTLEHRLYWLNMDGDISWGSDLSIDPARHLCPGPLGDRLFVATQSGRLLQLVW